MKNLEYSCPLTPKGGIIRDILIFIVKIKHQYC